MIFVFLVLLGSTNFILILLSINKKIIPDIFIFFKFYFSIYIIIKI